MNAEDFCNDLMENLFQFKPHFVFLTIGGNDIKHGSSPKEIAKRIFAIVLLNSPVPITH
jgi:lysophospholipase L1-like esterase